ncbi:MAG: 5-methylthioadenosine/S-adenosylhomocysteine nucleosidase [Pseudomonadota bacterium]
MTCPRHQWARCCAASCVTSAEPGQGRIAIISALHEELSAVLLALNTATEERVGGSGKVEKVSVAGREFSLGRLGGREVVMVLSKVGKVAAAATATVLAERFDVQAMLFTGVAGGLGPTVRVGDVVVASQFLQHDLDASPLFPRYEVPLYGRSRFDADPQLSAALMQAAQATLSDMRGTLGAAAVNEFDLHQSQVYSGLVISGDRFVSTSQESLALVQALPEAQAVEMEGAAIAQVCHDYGLPFAAVRTISDRADDAAHADFNRFISEVASRYSAAIIQRALALL